MKTKFNTEISFSVTASGLIVLYNKLENEEKQYEMNVKSDAHKGFRFIELRFDRSDLEHFGEIVDQSRKLPPIEFKSM